MTIILDNPVPTHSAPIAAIVEFENGTARHEIGTAKFQGSKATLVFYGTPAFEARLVISEGIKDIEAIHDLNH